LQQQRKIASAKHNALNSHNLALNAKENHISADDRQPSFLANLRPKPVEQRVLPDAAYLVAYFMNELDRAPWIVLRDVISNRYQITLDEGRKLDPH
jgi:hypothetical protein